MARHKIVGMLTRRRQQEQQQSRARRRKPHAFGGSASDNDGGNSSSSDREDPYHSYIHGRRSGKRSRDLVLHRGSCHCGGLQFEVRAPAHLVAVEGSGPLRFPYVRVPAGRFHLTTEEAEGSLYVVREGAVGRSGCDWQGGGPGRDASAAAHFFCRSCGVHVVHAPTFPSSAVANVNVHCINPATVASLAVAYAPSARTRPGRGRQPPQSSAAAQRRRSGDSGDADSAAAAADAEDMPWADRPRDRESSSFRPPPPQPRGSISPDRRAAPPAPLELKGAMTAIRRQRRRRSSSGGGGGYISNEDEGVSVECGDDAEEGTGVATAAGVGRFAATGAGGDDGRSSRWMPSPGGISADRRGGAQRRREDQRRTAAAGDRGGSGGGVGDGGATSSWAWADVLMHVMSAPSHPPPPPTDHGRGGGLSSMAMAAAARDHHHHGIAAAAAPAGAAGAAGGRGSGNGSGGNGSGDGDFGSPAAAVVAAVAAERFDSHSIASRAEVAPREGERGQTRQRRPRSHSDAAWQHPAPMTPPSRVSAINGSGAAAPAADERVASEADEPSYADPATKNGPSNGASGGGAALNGHGARGTTGAASDHGGAGNGGGVSPGSSDSYRSQSSSSTVALTPARRPASPLAG
ncbi:unnamed protein product [Phaeothamnion confervicola]